MSVVFIGTVAAVAFWIQFVRLFMVASVWWAVSWVGVEGFGIQVGKIWGQSSNLQSWKDFIAYGMGPGLKRSKTTISGRSGLWLTCPLHSSAKWGSNGSDISKCSMIEENVGLVYGILEIMWPNERLTSVVSLMLVWWSPKEWWKPPITTALGKFEMYTRKSRGKPWFG